MKAMRKRGIRVLPGGDYGFAWTPHGTYAQGPGVFRRAAGLHPHGGDPVSDPAGRRDHEPSGRAGLVRNGYLADLILLDGDPLQDITCSRTAAASWRS
ncbi:hypothetical protein [Azospirillum argentinense]|uniref:hypothetical protein n=1 Tax=Azospirillum argentinense TaxID=2970906 RepID=UPI001B3C0A15|nr:hypothetical protein [Azospirillum argentinense]